jgi:hypothetical protein
MRACGDVPIMMVINCIDTDIMNRTQLALRSSFVLLLVYLFFTLAFPF